MTRPTRRLAATPALRMLIMVAALASGATTAAATPEIDLPTAIAAASTPQEHENIASHFEREAQDFDQKIAQHQAMKQNYARGGHQAGFNAHMRAHCESLLKLYKAAAAENREMAASHRKMAKQMSK